MIIDNYIKILKNLKQQIIKSRYEVAKVANKELLNLYFNVGKIISKKVATEKWGNQTIKRLSDDLQIELSGLRGFSYSNLKNMRAFYEEWNLYFIDEITENNKKSISQSLTDQLDIDINLLVDCFTKLSFTAHCEIIAKTKKINERLFYIKKSTDEFWTVRVLKQHLKNKLFEKQGMLPNNFNQTISDTQQRQKSLQNFNDHYLLDFISLTDEEQDNERVLENEIVQNIKKFISTLGADFAFIGNQYRIIVDDTEYFVDLLFYNRNLQALVAIELKTGKFKPEYLGKMNFYLSALDEYIKQEHENPSIGIILCKEKKNKTVEFAFRDFNKAMGVATFNTSSQLPKKYKNILPDAKTLIKLLDENYD